MHDCRITAALLSAALATLGAGRLEGQSGARPAVWETLLEKPVPEESAPKISVFSIPVAPAPPVPRAVGAGHTHAGPVFAYILQGEIENQVEPDPPEIYKPGGFFYEAPGHVHRFLRNRSTTETANLIIFEEGATGQAAPAIKLLLEEPLRTTANQEVSLLRLTLPPGDQAEAGAHSGPGIVYVLEGKIEVSGTTDGPTTHSAGDLFLEPASGAGHTFKNTSGSGPARLLLYQVSERTGFSPAPAAPPGVATKLLMREPLGETSEPKMSLSFLTVGGGLTIPTHTHAGAVFAYILEGDIENQVEPEPAKDYHPGGFFYEQPMQVHRLLRNLSQTEPAKILIFQNTGRSASPLLQEPLAKLSNQEVSAISLVAAPGAAMPGAHQHPGAVFAYLVRGEIESQVDPDPPKIYRAGDVFYEPPMHAHRLFRNRSQTEPAELVIFEVADKDQPLAISAK